MASSFIMALLIPRLDSPGRDIDVYLCPLIDELRILWEPGVETYDCMSIEKFNMRVALMLTVNDFPTYRYLSGWSTSGYKACPTCMEDTTSVRLRDKVSYVDHRRFLPPEHPWRKSRDFNSKTKNRRAPIECTGEDCLRQLENVPSVFGKVGGKKRKRDSRNLNWTKRSILFELPYWDKLLLRHNIDVMHVGKKTYVIIYWKQY